MRIPRTIIFGAIVLIYWWLATAGDWNLFGQEEFGSFYDYQALAFRHGRLDVPAEAVGYEAFIYDGKYYGYWGPFPALLRLPLAVLGHGAWVGHTARISCFFAACLSLLAIANLAAALRKQVAGASAPCRPFELVGIVGMALGSTVVFLVAKPFVYHEVILWAGAATLLALWWAVNYLRTRRAVWLLLAATAGACAALTRPTLGFGSLVGTFGLAVVLAYRWRNARGSPDSPNPGRNLRLATVGLATAGIVGSFAYNYIRFGTWSPPYALQMLYTPARLEHTQGGHMFQPGNFREVLGVYVDPTRLQWEPRFPYFFLDQYWPDAKSGVIIDSTEPQAGLLATATASTLLAVAGLLLAARHLGTACLALGALVSIFGACIFAFVTERYLHDFFPALVLGVSVAMAYLSARRDVTSRFLKYVLGAGFAFAILQNFALALELQRKSLPPRAPAREGYENFSGGVDGLVEGFRRKIFHLPLPHMVLAAWADLPKNPRTGTVATVHEPFGMLWHDGVSWRKIAGTCDDIFEQRLQVTLPPDGVPRSEPLLAMGTKEAANIVFMQSDGSPLWSINCDVWGRAILRSKLWRPPGRTMDITVRLDRINQRVQLYNGNELLVDGPVLPHVVAGLPLHIGENPFGGSWSGTKFHGGITPLPPLTP